jgi:hypothetical protein
MGKQTHSSDGLPASYRSDLAPFTLEVERVVRPQYEKEFRQNPSNAKLIRSVRPPRS